MTQMTIEEMKTRLRLKLKQKRFIHSLNVMKTAAELAEIYGADAGKAEIAGLLHDCARDIKKDETLEYCRRIGLETDEICRLQPELLHGPLGAYLAGEDYGVGDESIITAIRWHTTGCKNMTLLTKLIFVADYIEPGRNFPGVEVVRKMADVQLDRAVLTALDMTISHVISKGSLLHPDTVDARNYIIMAGI